MPQDPIPSHIHTLGEDQRCTRCGWDGSRIRPGDTLRLPRVASPAPTVGLA
jgi:hypothetical protein